MALPASDVTGLLTSPPAAGSDVTVECRRGSFLRLAMVA